MKLITILAAIISAILFLTGCSENNVTSKQKQAAEQPDKLAVAEDNSSVEIEYDSFILENGLKVIFHIDRSDPVVAVALTAHVGSSRELPGRTGFAHLFEHLLFLESENLGKGGLDKMSARIGGSGANGSTSRDRTNYFQTVPKNALEKMIWAEADKLGFFINTVTEQVLAKEKQVVKNEKRQGVDNRPYGHTQYVIDKNLYPHGHPYSWQVIGSLEDLQAATLQDVKDFFNRWYVPNNVTLVIAGDFDTDQAKKWVHKYFDEIKRGPDVERLKKQPGVLKESKRISFEDNFARLPELTITWPTVHRYHPDYYALTVLHQLLATGKKAALNKVLIDELKLTNRVRMYGYDSEIAGQTQIAVRAFDGVDLDKVHQGINKAFENFEKNGFTEQDLDRIKATQETAFYRGLTSALGKGFQLAQYYIYTGDPGFINQDVKNILNVTSKDVWDVYNRYIKNQYFVATSFVPKGQLELALADSEDANVKEEKIVMGAEEAFDASGEATYKKTPSTFDRSQEPAYDESQMDIKTPVVWQKSLSNKMEILGIDYQEVPLVNFNLTIKGGMLFDSADKIGVANLTAALMNRGTKSKTPQQLEEAIQQLGAQISISASKQDIQIQGSCLSKNYQQTMALVSEMILEPRWDESEFALQKDSTLSTIKQQAGSPGTIAAIEFDRLIYGKEHLLANNLIGTEKSVQSITLEDLKQYYQSYLNPALASLQLVGDISEKDVVTSLATLQNKWRETSASLPKIEMPIRPEKAAIYFYDVPKAKQSMLRIGYPSLKATDPDYYPAQVMNYRLGGGGFASQLTQELREAKGYTYGIGSFFNGSNLTGRFGIATGVRANVTFEAVKLIKEIVSTYEEGFNERDLDVTKGFFLKSNARRFETPNAKLNILNNMSTYSLPADYVQQRAAEVKKLTVEDIKTLAGKYIDADKMIYLVVGDAETQLPRLEELGLGKAVLLNP